MSSFLLINSGPDLVILLQKTLVAFGLGDRRERWAAACRSRLHFKLLSVLACDQSLGGWGAGKANRTALMEHTGGLIHGSLDSVHCVSV